jgi:hypothetical protein
VAVVGPPTWATGVWADSVWAEGVWETEEEEEITAIPRRYRLTIHGHATLHRNKKIRLG